jgi:hypothetical protein
MASDKGLPLGQIVGTVTEIRKAVKVCERSINHLAICKPEKPFPIGSQERERERARARERERERERARKREKFY